MLSKFFVQHCGSNGEHRTGTDVALSGTSARGGNAEIHDETADLACLVPEASNLRETKQGLDLPDAPYPATVEARRTTGLEA